MADDFVPDMQTKDDFTPDTQQGGGSPPLGFVASQVMNMAPWNKANQMWKNAVGDAAGTLAQSKYTQNAPGLPPKALATALLPAAMAPEILGATTGWEGAHAPDAPPIIKGLVNTPQELSPEYDALHEAAGISKNLPIQRGNVLKFPDLAGNPSSTPPPFAPSIAPLTYAKDPNTLLNLAKGRMDALSDSLSPQELNDYRTLIGQMIDTGKVGAGKPLAMASQLKAQATDLLNNRVQGLADLNKAYAIAKTVQNPSQLLPRTVVDLSKKYGPWIISAASAIGIGSRVGRP